MNENITAKVELITPEVAKELLSRNDHNRKQTANNVKVIELALLNDEWQVSGQTIIIASNGDLMDGQHRLQAVVNTGIDMYHLVCRGVEPSVFSVIDTGKARNGADSLSISGVGNHIKVDRVVKAFNAYKQQSLHYVPKMTNTEVLRAFNADEGKYLNALEDGELYRTSGTFLTDVQWATLVLIMDTTLKGKDYIQALVNGEFSQVEEAILRARKSGNGRTNTTRVWVALLSGYGYFSRNKPVPANGIKTSESSTNSYGEKKTVAIDVPYPSKI